MKNNQNYNFPIDWEVKKLGEIGECIIGLTYSPNDVVETGGTLVLRSSNIRGSSIVLNDKDNVYVDMKLPEKVKVRVGDILICSRNGSRNLIGKNAIVPDVDEDIAFGAFMTVFRSSENEYVHQLLQTDFFRRQVHQNLGATINQLTSKDLNSFAFTFPSNTEQQKIANILSTWDKAMVLKEKLIEEKKKQKSGLMQKLLTGKVRLPGFNGEWEFAELSTVCDKVTRCIDKPSEPYYRLGLRSHAKGTFHEYVENPDDNSMDKLYIVKENDLIVNITFAWEHAIALAGSNDDGKLVSHRFPTYLFKDNAEPRFYKHYVMQSKFKKMLDDISPGGAGRNRVMNQKSFLKLMVHIPSLEEQKAIANVLDLLNKEISLHQSELDSLKQQKKGLMQLLLTGIVRVSVETN